MGKRLTSRLELVLLNNRFGRSWLSYTLATVYVASLVAALLHYMSN